MKNVLLATDGSSHAEDAARFLSHLPHQEKLALTVLTVLEAPYVNFHYPTSDWIEEAVKLEKARAVESFQKIEALFTGANVDLKHIVRDGTRATTIVEVAQEIKSQLIILGAKGRSTVSRILLGSVSDHVATHAHCSVLVVRPTKNRQSGQPLRITIGYEETGPATAALEEFSETNWGTDTDVRIVSVVAYLADMFRNESFDGAGIKESVLETVRRATEQLADSAPTAIATVIESEHIGEGLVVYATEHDTDLLVVGETSRSALGRAMMGSVSRYVLRHAPCSVWISRNRFVTGNALKKSKQKSKASTS